MSAVAVTIGGSEAAAACGLDPWKSRVQLWLEKTGRVPREEDTEAARWGRLLEPLLAEETERVTGSIVTREPAATLYGRKGVAFMTGHPDGFTQASGAVWEGKTAGLRQAWAWADGEVPVQYYCQAQHYMLLSGLPVTVFGVLIGGQRFETRTVERDDKAIENLIWLEREFFDLVESDEPPDPDGSDSAERMLDLLYPRSIDSRVTLATAHLTALAELRKRKAQLKTVQGQCDELEQTIKMAMGDAGVALDARGTIVARWQTVERKAYAVEASSFRRFTLAKERIG